MKNTHLNVQLTFPPSVSSQPVVCNLSKLFDLTFNILQAKITPDEEGFLVLELIGSTSATDEGLAYLNKQGIIVSLVEKYINLDTDSCMQCGMCTSLCPSKALSINTATRQLVFLKEKCTVCTRCLNVCPVRALKITAA